MTAAYIVGLPGSGKSTLMRAITEGLAHVGVARPFAHQVYLADGEVIGVQLGAAHPEFGGTDRLSMSVQAAATRAVGEWRRRWPACAVVAEGDRLATATFLDALGGDLVWLDTPAELAAERRAGRSTNQSEAWVKGRATKVRNLVESRPHVRLDGSLSLGDVVAQAVAQVPALAALRGRA